MDEIKKIFLESSSESSPLATHILRFPGIKKEYPFNVNDFSKEEIIGSGSFGIVKGYKHRLSNYHIAVKFINIPSKVQYMYNDTKKLVNEIKIHCLLPHAPNIVDFYGIGIHDNKLWICMERMDMSLKMVYLSIHEILGYFHEKLLHYIMVSVINGLEHCKENKIIHRDLKPDNVLVNWSGEVKLCDFGLSKNYENSNIGVSSNVGTVTYWPPERCQLNDSSMFENYDARSDIWGLGLMSLELICGVMPYKIYLDKSNIRFDNPIELTKIISNIDVVLLIDKCFLTLQEEHHQHYSSLTKQFIRSCLKEYETRPNYDVLKPMLYQQFFEDPKYLCNKIAEELECINQFYTCEEGQLHLKPKLPEEYKMGKLGAKMDKFGIEFTQDIINELQLHNFLTAQDEMQIFILVTEYNMLSAIKLSQVLKGITEYKKYDSHVFIPLSSLLRIQERVIEAFNSESNNLLIIECKEDKFIEEKDLQGIQRQLSQIINANIRKKIVLITKQENALTDLFKQYHNNYQETTDNKNSFTDLTTESQNKLLQECKIILQGYEISLNKLIDENSKELIDSTTLVKLINNDKITMCHELISLGDTQNYYIPRTFNYQTVIKTEIFKEDKVKYLLAISDIDEARLRRLVPEDHKISLFQEYDLDKSNDIRSIILNKGQAAEQFKQLRQHYPALNIHWLKSESDQLIWQQSQGSISGLHKYIDESHTKYYSETELLSQADQYKVMIISDTAGMGKTTVLTSLSQLFKQQAPDLCIVRIDLNNYTKELQEQKVRNSFKTQDIDKAIEFLSNDILKLGTPLERAIFESYIQKMIVMFDGFDEISPDYRDIVIDLVKVLRNSTIKQLWVTTRPNERDILEDKLQQLSYKLEPFSKPNQVNFLTKFWQQTSGLSEVTQEQQERLTDYAKALIGLLTKSIKYKDTELTGIPLQTRMLAEAFEKDFAELFKTKEAKLQLPENLDLIDLYECFLKKKYDIQLEKSKLDISQPNVKAHSETEYSKFIEKHQNLALYTLFPEDKVEMFLCEKFYQEFSQEYPQLAKLNENNKQLLFEDKKRKLLSFINDIKTSTVNTGIIHQIIEDKPHFIHRTFAEYLIGKFLVASLDNEKIFEFVLQEVLMHPAYQVTRAFLNGQLPEFIPENTLARYGKQIGRLWQSNKNFYNKKGATLLHIAVEEAAEGGYLDVVQCLVEHGADVNVKSNSELSALHWAAQKNKWDVVKWLVEHGNANVDATDNDGQTILHWAALGNLDVVQWLVEHGKANIEATDKYGQTVLHRAVQENKWDVVQWLVEHGKANVDATDKYGRTVLHWAALGNLDAVKWLVEHGKANIDAIDNDGQTVLHWAAQKNKWDVVQWLVEHGKANVEAIDNHGKTMLHWAAQKDKWDVVQWLVKHGKANVEATDNDGWTVLHWATWGNFDIVQWLVEHEKSNVEVKDKYGQTVLHCAAKWKKWDVVQWLVEHGKAIIEATDNDGRTVLHWATWGNLNIVQWLVEYGEANVDAIDNDGQTVLHCAAKWNKWDVVQWLVEHGKANIEATDKYGQTVLHRAVQENKWDVVQWLVEHGKANIEATNKYGQTVLHKAVQENKWDFVQCLVEHGVDVNAKSKDGKTVLHYAAQENKWDVFQWLVEHIYIYLFIYLRVEHAIK